MNKKGPVSVGIGELLWELHPDGKKLGGLPADFVYHSKHLGADAYLVSAVGNDSLGKELIKKLSALGIDNRFVQISGSSRTGTLSFTLDDRGNASCLIDEPAAWDNVTWNNELKSLASKADIICFGILAQRSSLTKESILKFLDSAKTNCLKIFDMNLTLNSYSTKSVMLSLEKANMLRVNKTDLKSLAEMLSIKGNEEFILDKIFKKFNLQLIALTKSNGINILISSAGKSKLITPKIEIFNQNGFGDGFTAFLTIEHYKKSKLNGQKRWL
jgi:fructokinase